MKKQLKLMSLVLSIALLLISAAPITARAFDSIDMDDNAELITPSANAIYSVWGSAAPASLCQKLAALNVAVTANTLIEILPMDSGFGTALAVTNLNSNTVIKDFILGLGENGQFAEILPIDDGAAELMDGTTIGYPDDMSVVRASAVYEVVWRDSYIIQTEPYVRPLGSYFFYYASGGQTVTYVDIEYVCSGYVHTYPEFEDIGGDFPYTYSAPVIVENPASNTMYSYTQAYPANRVLQLGVGLSDHKLYLDLVADGTHYHDYVTIYVN